MEHLKAGQRYTIYTLISKGFSQKEIAGIIGVHPSTVSREIRRNSDRRDGKYKCDQAQRKYERRLRSKAHASRFTGEMKAEVRRLISECAWSPEQICWRLRKEGKAMVSHETIYQFVWEDKKHGGTLYRHLRRRGRRCRKRGGEYAYRGSIPGRTDISERPAEVERRTRFGDLEIDTVIGRNRRGALLTINDRATGLVWIRKLEGKSAAPLAEAAVEALMPYKGMIHTITADNGREFTLHAQIARELGISFYFCRPYHSWERGANENTNGLIRQYVPKKTDLSNIDDDYIEMVQNQLNNRPRKRLAWLTPIEKFKLINNNNNNVALTT